MTFNQIKKDMTYFYENSNKVIQTTYCIVHSKTEDSVTVLLVTLYRNGGEIR